MTLNFNNCVLNTIYGMFKLTVALITIKKKNTNKPIKLTEHGVSLVSFHATTMTAMVSIYNTVKTEMSDGQM